MEKLMALLNEFLVQRASGYIHYHSEGEFKRTPTVSAVEGDKMLQDEYICSKKFGFIKWLVENDKIDRDKSKIITAKTEIVLGMNFNDVFVITNRYWLYEQLLMLLAIQDEPINFLISILK